MVSSIQRLFPALINDFNIIYSNLKNKDGFMGVDVILHPDTQIPVTRIIIEGVNRISTGVLVNSYRQILDGKLNAGVLWDEITREFQSKINAPGLNQRKTEFFSTIQPGITVGVGQSFGTLGLICYDKHTSQPCMLTAFHVAEDSNLYQPYFPFIQNLIGDFLRYDPAGDSAIYSFNTTFTFSRDFSGAGVAFDTTLFDTTVTDTPIKIKTTEFPKLGERLNKIGVVTNNTKAIVKGIGIYKHDRVGEVVWVEGFWLIPENPKNPNDIEISFQGDSGSIWYNESTNAGVGLLIAGDQTDSPPVQEFAIAQHLSHVLENLNIQLIQS
jgi:endonuclease G